MNHRCTVGLFSAATILLCAVSLSGVEQPLEPDKRPDRAKEELVEQVRRAMDRGIQYLRDQENGRGHWENDAFPTIAAGSGGETSLVLLALLTAGVKPDDPVIERGLEYLRKIQPQHTYTVGLQTMVFAAAGKDKDREKIQRNVDWLIKARSMNGNRFSGWSYSAGGVRGDNSNTQYALLGLHEGRQAGAKIDREVWESIRKFYVDSQNPDGGWGYIPFGGDASRLTMTTAGLCGLYISGMELNGRREEIQPDGTATHCGKYDGDEALAKAHAFLGQRLRIEVPPFPTYYNLYGIERAGRLSAQRFLGEHDWYREGCEFLVKNQKEDGSWAGRSMDSWSVVSTSFALLFLSKGRTPILISKLVHGPGDDWNNDRLDVHNLVDHARKEVFKRQPLAWQTFDGKRTPVENRDDLLNLTADLLQSPIVYFNGHAAPKFTQNEEALLKEYIEQGGFVLAEACCGSKDFDRGFRALMKRLFPDDHLEPLSPEHPIWRAHAVIDPRSFPLEGLQRGCKTVLVYSPKDLSCLWEANRKDTEQGLLAFRLGGNIIAYATGMELPKPRLTPMEVIRDQDAPKKVPRGSLKVAQIRHEGDWQPAPRAMRNLMLHLREKGRLDVALQTEPIRLSHPDLPDFKFLYMQGRNAFTFSDEEIKNLRANLQTNGLLLADASCGKDAFDKSFREFLVKLFPDLKLEQIPLTDDLYSKELNGEAIATVRRRECGAENTFRDVPPTLEGIKFQGRWVVIYSKYDLGCALEKQRSSDCKGHDYESALRLGTAVVLYALKR